MGAASKFLMLLSTSFPFLHPPRYALRLACHSRSGLVASLSTASSLSYIRFCAPVPIAPHLQRASFSLRAADDSHTGATARVDYEQLPEAAKSANSWPEWSRFVEHVSAYGTKRTFSGTTAISGCDDDDSFSASCDVPEDFARAAEACLAFARERPALLKLLLKKDVKVLVDNGSPFLFTNGLNSSRRMLRYLSNEGFSLSGAEAAETIDLMRYLLSYLYSQLVTSKTGSFSATVLVTLSVNDLLSDMVNTSRPVRELPQISKPPTQKVEMKMGDWICPKCSYMNFARNLKCLKCDEGRPKRQLTGGEWECPQCDFYNYGKNMACLRCDCKRPMSASHESSIGYMRQPSFEQIHSQGSSTSGVELPLSNKDVKAELRSDKVPKPINSSVISNIRADEDFSETISQKGPSRLTNMPKHSGLLAEGSKISSVDTSNKSLDSSITRSLEKILAQSSSTSESVGTSQKEDSTSIPFVPLPPDMFKNNQSSNMEGLHLENRVSSAKADLQNIPSKRFQSGQPTSAPYYRNSQNFIDDKEVSNAPNLSEQDEKKQASLISENDFPEIMPLRKGENRFVVSRKKDRSLTSPQYKRRLAMEQAGGSSFVPFVPFPPGYFARKGNQAEDGVPTRSETVNSVPGKTDISEAANPNGAVELDATQSTRKSWNSESFRQNISANSHMSPNTSGGYNSSPLNDGNEMRTTDCSQVDSPPVLNSSTSWDNNHHTPNFTRVDSRISYSSNQETPSSWNRNQEGRNSEFSDKIQPNDTNLSAKNPNSYWNKNEQTPVNRYSSWNSGRNTNTTVKVNSQAGKGSSGGFTGNSLEGSAVPEEPDPLDMSEEAKAQRWFRRVAQITDISELSNIPDEDFPEIMPMRKGVNRFVVSKRKTPLERRLTSPQYRRNLPIVSSEPEKDSN